MPVPFKLVVARVQMANVESEVDDLTGLYDPGKATLSLP